MSETSTPVRDLDTIERELDGVLEIFTSTFERIGQLLMEIRDNELWKGGEYDTWAAYVNGRFNKTKRWANQSIHSYKALLELNSYEAREEVNRWDRTHPEGHLPDGSLTNGVDPEDQVRETGTIVPTLNEWQVRELTKIKDPAERQEVYDTVVTDLATGKTVTAKSIASGGGRTPKKTYYSVLANSAERIQRAAASDGVRERRTLEWVRDVIDGVLAGSEPLDVPDFITVDKPFIDITFEANYCQIRGSWGIKQLIEEVGGHAVFSNVTHSWGCSAKHGRDLLALLESRRTHVVRVEG